MRRKMGFKNSVTVNGMTGEPYFVIVQVEQHKLQGIATVYLRSFESREKLHEALMKNNQDDNGNPLITPITDESFVIPLNDNKDLTTEEAYTYIKEKYYTSAIDVI